MKLAFRRHGAGEPLLILHGLFGSLNNWNTLSRVLGAEYAVYALDLRNHGRSPHHPVHTYPAMAEDLIGFMEEQGMARTHVLGHSMGGKAAMEFALAQPARVGSLIVVDIAPVSYPPGHDRLMEALDAVNPAAFSSRQEVDAALRPGVPDERTRQFLLTNLQRRDDGSLVWKMNLEALRRNAGAIASGLQDGREFGGPVLALRGAGSPYVRPEHEAAFRKLFPAVEFAVIPGAGHWVHADAPGPFLEAVTSFLHKHPLGIS